MEHTPVRRGHFDEPHHGLALPPRRPRMRVTGHEVVPDWFESEPARLLLAGHPRVAVCRVERADIDGQTVPRRDRGSCCLAVMLAILRPSRGEVDDEEHVNRTKRAHLTASAVKKSTTAQAFARGVGQLRTCTSTSAQRQSVCLSRCAALARAPIFYGTVTTRVTPSDVLPTRSVAHKRYA